jgi:hypothetical protein
MGTARSKRSSCEPSTGTPITALVAAAGVQLKDSRSGQPGGRTPHPDAVELSLAQWIAEDLDPLDGAGERQLLGDGNPRG